MNFTNARASTPASQNRVKLSNMMFFTNQIYSQENGHSFKVIGRMGVPIDDPRSTDPIFYLNWEDGIV